MLRLKYPDVFKHPGFISSYVTGRRGKKTPDSKLIKLLADFFHVEFEWLLLGSGPVRREGRGETPAETALFFARTMRIREDAWEVAWERNKDRAESMTVEDWFNAIRSEAERLDRAGIARPEEQAAALDEQGKIRRARKKLDRAKEARTHAQNSVETAPVVRVVGGK